MSVPLSFQIHFLTDLGEFFVKFLPFSFLCKFVHFQSQLALVCKILTWPKNESIYKIEKLFVEEFLLSLSYTSTNFQQIFNVVSYNKQSLLFVFDNRPTRNVTLSLCYICIFALKLDMWINWHRRRVYFCWWFSLQTQSWRSSWIHLSGRKSMLRM